jgi:hypothetical protein
MPKHWKVSDDLLSALATTSPAAQQIVDQIRSNRRGRPAAVEADYRQLAFRWRSFRKLNSGLTDEQAAKKFLRVHGNAIETALHLKRNTVGSLRKGVARGAKEHERVKRQRRAVWQLAPASLAQAVHGRRHVISTNPYLRAAHTAALLGTSVPGLLFDPFKVR